MMHIELAYCKKYTYVKLAKLIGHVKYKHKTSKNEWNIKTQNTNNNADLLAYSRTHVLTIFHSSIVFQNTHVMKTK